MKRKLLMILFGFALMLTGCAKEVSRETINTTGVVIEVDYDSAWFQSIFNGKTTTMIHHPADYDTCIKYNKEVYLLDNSSIYNYCIDKIGQEVEIEVVIVHYDDGTSDTYINSVGGITE
jgi:hypothetical protein